MPDGATVRSALLKLALVVLLCYLAFLAREIWLPLILAFLIAMVLDPVVDRMELRGWSRTAASIFIFGSFVIFVAGMAILLWPLLLDQAASIQSGFERYFPNTTHAGLVKSFQQMGFPIGVSRFGAAAVENGQAEMQRSSGWITQHGVSVLSGLVWVVIVPIVAFYSLRDFHLILAKALLLVPKERRDLVQTAVAEITAVFGKYLRGLAVVSILNGIATGLLLWAIGVPGAAMLGAVAGVLYSVPYIGPLLTLLITGAVAFVAGGPHLLMLAVGLSIVLHQIVFDQFVTPRILGRHVGLHPIISIVALLVGNLLLGIIGMILAVPVAACVQIAVLAVVPKLSQEIQIDTSSVGNSDTVEQVAEEMKATEQKVDATHEIHAAVTSAVESIEEQASEEAPRD